MTPKISVVVPVYNGGAVFLKTLESICAQTEGDFELIVVNDGSTDNTEKDLAAFATKDPRVRPFSIPNGGSSRARNYGLEQARGKYLYFCDADDIPEPEILARLSAELDKGAQLAACGYIQEMEAEGRRIGNTVYTAPDFCCDTRRAFLQKLPELMEGQLMYVNWNKMYRMELVRETKAAFDPRYGSCEDRLFNLAYFPAVERFSFVGEPLFHYYVRGRGSLASRFFPNKYESLTEFDRVLTGLYAENGLLTEEVKAVNARILVKGAVACLISLYHPSCKLSPREKKAFAREMLGSGSMANALENLSGGLHFKLIGLAMKTRWVGLNLLLGRMAGFAGRRLPGLLQRLKNRK